MDYEQEYNKLVNAIKVLQEANPSDEGIQNWVNDNVPELRESEDEEVRKDILAFVKREGQHIDKYKWHKWIAWLEKQDKTKEYTFKSLPRLLDMIEPTDRAKSYCQKLIDTLLTEGYDTDAKIVKEYLKQMNGETVAMAVMDGQTITDKYEPKFKIGDWVVWDNKMSCYIDNIYQGKESLMYTIIDTNNIIRSCSVKIFDNNSHLWSIKDAKDGDVLAVDSMPFIYNGSKNEVTVGAYCGFNAKHRFSFAYNYVINQNITPATKEQCDMLFQKINEAGYTFDFKKKKLKEIHVIDEGKSEMEYCFTKMMNGEKVSSAWGEKYIADVFEKVGLAKIVREQSNYNLTNALQDAMIELSKFIPQPKQEWGEEDERMYSIVFEEYKNRQYYSHPELNDYDISGQILGWLKSLKQRYTWKPSKEQLKFLQHYADQNNYDGTVLTSLLNDLKKL